MACGLGLVVNTAWLSDDAYITLRTIDNFWQGYGLRWNVVERVQAYTHPLWMLLVGSLYGITRAPYATTIAVSIACTLGTLAIVPRVARSRGAAVAAIVVLISSRSFIEYSTSGLENPLSHLLLALFVWQYVEMVWPQRGPRAPSLWLLSVLGGLCAVNRLDTVWLTVPPIIAIVWTRRTWRAALEALAGVLPALAWEAFALLYYGFALPNTAYAKLATGVSTQALAHQGLRYLRDSLLMDHVTLPVIAIGISAGFWAGRAIAPLSVSVALSVASIVMVGGDFMSGRFLSAPFVVATLLLCRVVALDSSVRSGLVAAAVILVSVWSPGSPWRVWRHPPLGGSIVSRGGHGIADERAMYYPYTGLIPVLMGASPDDHLFATTGRSLRTTPLVAVYEAVGFFGFYAGPAVHIIDPMALTDPLLARLPAEPGWRIGHFKRRVPDGYVATMEQCLAAAFPQMRVVRTTTASCAMKAGRVNLIRDPAIAGRYEEIALLTQGALWDPDRLRRVFSPPTASTSGR